MTDIIDGNGASTDLIDGNLADTSNIIDGNDQVSGEILIGDPSKPSPTIDSRNVSLESMDGSIVVPLNADTERILLGGATGLQLAPRTVVTGTTPGMPGSYLQEIDILQREVFIPLEFASESSQADFFAKLAQLRNVVSSGWDTVDIGDLGTFRLVFTSSLGERILNVVYSDGLEGNWGADASGPQWEKFGLTLIAVDPFFRDRNATTRTYTTTPGEPFLSDGSVSAPWPRTLAPSVVIGEDMPILVDGDVAVWPVIEITGPVSTASVQFAGTAINIPDGVPDGSVLTLVTDPRARSARMDGAIAWPHIDGSATFTSLRPGVNTVSVLVGTAGDGASLELEWVPGYESAY